MFKPVFESQINLEIIRNAQEDIIGLLTLALEKIDKLLKFIRSVTLGQQLRLLNINQADVLVVFLIVVGFWLFLVDFGYGFGFGVGLFLRCLDLLGVCGLRDC